MSEMSLAHAAGKAGQSGTSQKTCLESLFQQQCPRDYGLGVTFQQFAIHIGI